MTFYHVLVVHIHAGWVGLTVIKINVLVPTRSGGLSYIATGFQCDSLHIASEKSHVGDYH